MQMSWKSVFFTDINTGYAVGLPDVYIPGDSSKIFKTTDGELIGMLNLLERQYN